MTVSGSCKPKHANNSFVHASAAIISPAAAKVRRLPVTDFDLAAYVAYIKRRGVQIQQRRPMHTRQVLMGGIAPGGRRNAALCLVKPAHILRQSAIAATCA